MRGQKKVRRLNFFKNSLLIVFSIILIAAIVFGVVHVNKNFKTADTSSIEQISSEASSVVKEIVPVSTARISSVGDLLMHIPLINHAKTSSGEYDFNYIYTYLSHYVEKADYAVANLETTLAGEEKGWSGYPSFNCPDTIVDATKTAGFDMLLTANNHSYDSRLAGFLRTQEVIDQKGMDRLGTKLDKDVKDYVIKDVNGINFGILCYTYETKTEREGRKALNGILLSEEATNLITSFNYNKLDEFQAEIKENVAEMKQNGADVIITYIHWGNEYQTKESAQQRKVAQMLCDEGIDVIIGGHPHVVQPIDLIESENGNKTVCLYSLGNAVSNQRKDRMNLKTGHTEDGLLFSVNFTKYSDGHVTFDSIDATPTWVNLHTKNGKRVYEILPLDYNTADTWKESYGLTTTTLKNAQSSYERTIKIIESGLNEVNDFLSGKTEQKEDVSESSDTSTVSSN